MEEFFILMEGLLSANFGTIMQIIALTDVIPPPVRRNFSDVYIATELMDTDLHQIIRSAQVLSEEHSQVNLYTNFCVCKQSLSKL